MIQRSERVDDFHRLAPVVDGSPADDLDRPPSRGKQLRDAGAL
jgi:hypothetical protein